jgi:hypothetical protein
MRAGEIMSDYVAEWASRLARENKAKPKSFRIGKEREKRRKGFEKNRHVVVGAELYKLRGELMSLSNGICKTYGPASKAYKQAARLQCEIDRLRSTLDGQLAKETGMEEWRAEELQRVYYPNIGRQ